MVSKHEFDSFLSRLPGRLRWALDRADGGAKALVSITLPLRLSKAARPLPPELGTWFYWNRPDLGCCRLGLGAISLGRATGCERLDLLATAYTGALADWTRLDPERCGQAPLLFTAFAFDSNDPMQANWQGFPNSLLVLPELLLQQNGNDWSLTFSRRTDQPPERTLARWLKLARGLPQWLAGPASGIGSPMAFFSEHPTQAQWLKLAAEAVDSCREPGLHKLVLARRLRLHAPVPWPVRPLLDSLIREFPSSQLFGASLGSATLVSASPERLISLNRGELRCDAMGGTLAPADEWTPAQSAVAGKLAREHGLIVEAIAQALAPVCSRLNYPDHPRLLRLRDLRHLWTEIRAQADPQQNLFSLAARLHPTPAVNGSPRQAARDWLRRHEPFRRGWYAGAGGWLEPNGDGELAVLLRCALLDGTSAELYAGAGILGDSDPVAEFAETELKLRTIQQALRPETRGETRRAAGE